MRFFSNKPFVSKDGVDNTGIRAEVRVSLGFGEVKEITPSAAGKNIKVSFGGIPKITKPIYGWVEVSENDANIAKQAMDENRPLHFRIETARQSGLSRTIPMSELISDGKASSSVWRRLVAVRFDDQDEWVFSSSALTNPNEDPDQRGVISAMVYSPEQLKEISMSEMESKTNSKLATKSVFSGEPNAESVGANTTPLFDGDQINTRNRLALLPAELILKLKRVTVGELCYSELKELTCCAIGCALDSMILLHGDVEPSYALLSPIVEIIIEKISTDHLITYRKEGFSQNLDQYIDNLPKTINQMIEASISLSEEIF